MRATAILATALSLVISASQAAPSAAILHGPHATAEAILKTELAFEARSVSAGSATAFREYMDPVDGLEFGSGPPLRGATAIAADMEKTSAGQTLAWVPQEIFASTGDLGVVWGTWSLALKAGGKKMTGRYVTVWRKDRSGAWKGLVDIGNPDP